MPLQQQQWPDSLQKLLPPETKKWSINQVSVVDTRTSRPGQWMWNEGPSRVRSRGFHSSLFVSFFFSSPFQYGRQSTGTSWSVSKSGPVPTESQLGAYFASFPLDGIHASRVIPFPSLSLLVQDPGKIVEKGIRRNNPFFLRVTFRVSCSWKFR